MRCFKGMKGKSAMDCEHARELIWDEDILPPEESAGLERHLAGCSACAREAEEIAGLRRQLRMPEGADTEAAGARVAARALRMGAAGRGGRLGYVRDVFTAPRALGLAAAAAAVVIAVMVVAPMSGGAIALDALAAKHAVCLREGHVANYECHTEVELAEKMMSSIGVAPAAFRVSADEFVGGDICMIDSVAAAHALYRVDGVLVSRFMVAGEIGADRAVQVAEGVWRYESGKYSMILIKIRRGLYDVYAGEVPFNTLRFFTKADLPR